MNNNWIKLAREGGSVKRYHTRDLIKPQDNAQHSFNSAIIARELCSMFEDVDVNKVVMHMLIHDIPEIGIGDIPHYVKNSQPQIKKALDKAEEGWCRENMPSDLYDNMMLEGFTEQEVFIVKFTDQLEPMYKMLNEIKLGSKDAVELLRCMSSTCMRIINRSRDITDTLQRHELSQLVFDLLEEGTRHE